MLESLRNLKTTEIELRQQLPPPEGEWLVGRLLAKRGIANATWRGHARRLLIEYDANLFGSGEILSFLRYPCGAVPNSVAGG